MPENGARVSRGFWRDGWQRLRGKFRRRIDEVFGVDRQVGVAAFQVKARAATHEGEVIVQIDRMHHRFQFVKTVGAFSQNVQQEIDLAE